MDASCELQQQQEHDRCSEEVEYTAEQIKELQQQQGRTRRCGAGVVSSL